MTVEQKNWAAQRAYRRASLNCNIDVYDEQENQIPAQLVDISGGGCRICSEIPVSEQQVYRFCIMIPDIQIFGEIVFNARCVWSKQDEDMKHHHAGFQLHNVTDEDVDRIVWLIDEFGIDAG